MGAALSPSPAGPCGAFLLAEGNGSELALRAAVAEEKKRKVERREEREDMRGIMRVS
jgi:hypothetical protein